MSNHARRPQQLKSDFNSYYTNQAKIFAESNAKMSNSIQELPTTRSPYNPEIFCDVDQRVTQYIKQSERRPVLTKYSYGAVKDGAIALYDPKTDINMESIPEYQNRVFHKNLMERARAKVEQRNGYRLPSYDQSPPPSTSSTTSHSQYMDTTSTDDSQTLRFDNINPNRQYIQNVSIPTSSDTSALLNISQITSSSKPLIDMNDLVSGEFAKHHTLNLNGTNVESFAPNMSTFNNTTSTQNSSNGATYNPHLPYSDTNIPPSRINPLLNDERIDQYNMSLQRPWKWTEEISRDMNELYRSPMIKERNERQHAADDALFHRTAKFGRWAENPYAYQYRPVDTSYVLDKNDTKSHSKQSERKEPTLDPNTLNKERFTDINRDDTFNLQSQHNLSTDVLSSKRNIIEKEAKKAYHDNKRDTEKFSNANVSELQDSAFITPVARTLWKMVGKIKERFSAQPDRADVDDNGTINLNTKEPSTNGLSTTTSDKPESQNRQYIKSDHMMVIRDGVSEDNWREANNLDTAYMYVCKDATGIGASRIVAYYEDNNTLRILKRRSPELIYNKDTRPIENDCLIIDLKVDDLDTDFRKRIQKWNPNAKRKQPLQFDIDDFREIYNIATNHPSLQKREQQELDERKQRGNLWDNGRIWDEMKTSIEKTGKILIDRSAINQYRMEEKFARNDSHDTHYKRFRSDKIQENYVADVITTKGRLQPADTYDDFSLNKYQMSAGGSIRSKGVNLNAF